MGGVNRHTSVPNYTRGTRTTGVWIVTKKASVSWPDWMDQEIDRRKVAGLPTSRYVQEALQARFDAEDADEWETPQIEPPMEAADAD